MSGPSGRRLDAVTPDRALWRPLVVLPAWNEEETLGGVLDELAAGLPDWDVLVVSDGSTDATAGLARARGVPVLDLPFNLGVGGAMRAGFVYALRTGHTHVAQLDADGQHDPAELGRLVATMAETGADVVVGARFAGRGDYAVRGPRRWAMALLSRVLSRVNAADLTDTTSGFKLLGPRAVQVFALNYPAEYLGDTVEALVIAARTGLVVRQTPVVMRKRAGGTPSHSPLRAAVFLLRALLALGVALTRPKSVYRLPEGAS